MHIIMAIGELNDDIEAAMKQAVKHKLEEDRTAKNEETRIPTEVIRLAFAASQGKPRPKGIEHKVFEAKLWRERGTYLDRLKARVAAGTWEELILDAESAWQKVEVLSQAAGVPCIGRDGEWKLKPDGVWWFPRWTSRITIRHIF